MLKTWDIFDTLIARRCILPHSVFQMMEQITKFSGLMQARIIAEQQLARRGVNYNIDDIYLELEKISGLNKEVCNILKGIECQMEIEQAIPITENIVQVKAGDILISDMYLPEEIIRKMLENCGLLVPVEIVITSGGKASGRVWRQLAAQNQFVFHIGDNEINDIKNSRDAGFDSALTILSNPNIAEQFLAQKDFNFAAYLREIRLRNPYKEEIKRKYWEFFTLNVGILIILVQLIDDLQKKCGFEYLGFCGRDTYYLRLLYERFKEDKDETPTPNDYLYYSRKLIHTSEDEMAKYFSAKIAGRKALMIDVIGTGTHLNRLRKNGNLDYSILICLHDEKNQINNDGWLSLENWTPATNIPENIAETLDTKNMSLYFMGYEYIYFKINDALEHFNRANHNTPIKLNNLEIGNSIVPNVIFSEVSDTEQEDVFKKCFNEILNSKIAWKEKIKLDELKQLLTIFKDSVNPILLNQRHSINEIIDLKTTLKK